MELVLVAVAWLLGISAVALWQAPGWMAGAWILVASPAVFALRGRAAALTMLAMAVAAAIGGANFERWSERPPPAVTAWIGAQVTIEGRIASEADPGETTVRYRLDTEALGRAAGAASAIEGGVLLTLDQYASFEPGDRVRVTGRLDEPPSFPDFDYRGYLARRGIGATMLFPRVELQRAAGTGEPRRIEAAVRGHFVTALQRAIPEPEASLGSGIVFGRDGEISDELYDDFRRSGLAHVVAVSGSNVALITWLTFAALTRFLRRGRAILPAIATALIYVVLAGGSPSVVRAGIMAGVALVGSALGRPASGLAALGLAAIVMTWQSPGAALDVGFQLSLAATAGLVVFGPWAEAALDAGLERARLRAVVPEIVAKPVALSLATTLSTLPIIWLNFGQVSLVGPLLNVAIGPLFAAAFWLAALTAMAGTAWAPAGWACGVVAYYPLHVIASLATSGARLPAAAVQVPRLGSEVAFAASSLLVVAGCVAYRFLPPDRVPAPPARREVRGFAIGVSAGLLALLAWRWSLAPIGGPGELRVDILDVGQGDAILVTTPGGTTTLIDGGPSGIQLARELGAVLPHWQRSIDRTILTHPDQDHVGGLPGLLQRFNVDDVSDNGASTDSATFAHYAEARPVRPSLIDGDRWETDGVAFEVLWPSPAFTSDRTNERGIVLRVTYGDTSFLFTADIEASAQRALMGEHDVRATVLKVPHHGARTSTTEFLYTVDPKVAVISVGEGNRYGHPAAEVVAAMASSRLLRTDKNGRVTVTSDGSIVHVSTER